MARHISPVLDIDRNSRGWTVLVQVVERNNIQTSWTTLSKKMMQFLFTDSEGTKVSAIMYDSCIRLFYNLLWPFKRYYISNAVVNHAPLPYRVSEYEYSWIINSTTLVEVHAEQIPPPLPCTFQLTNFADLHKYADLDLLQNVKAVVMHVFPPKQQGSGATARDFVIVNEEKKPLLLTLWNEFEENQGNKIASVVTAAPVIIAMRVKVATFNTLSLTSRMASSFLLNPPLPDLMHMKEWYASNKEQLKMLLEVKAYKNPRFLLPLPDERDIITIKAAQDAFESTVERTKKKAVWVRGDAALIFGQTKFWYISCVNCQKSVNADVNWMITCPSCKENTQAELRCRIAITLTDPTGTLNCAIFGEDAEKLIPFTAAKLKEDDEKGAIVEAHLADSIKKHTITCFLRSYDVEFHGQMQKRHNIHKAYTLDESFSLSQPLIHEEMAASNIPVGTSITSSQQITTKEMFTPTTKMVLEEIAGQTAATHVMASTSTAVKRALFCTEEDTQNSPLAAETSFSPKKNLIADHSLQLIPQTPAAHTKESEESPSKKPKATLESH